MGDGEVTPDTQKQKSFTEVFEEIFPYYLAIGMNYDQFWNDEPVIAKYYREADDIRRRRANEELWLAGMYTADALLSTVGNMFSKQKYKYPAEPRPVTRGEILERKEREEKTKAEQIKARFIARALNINKRMGGDPK